MADPWDDERYAPGHIPTMVTPAELDYLHWLTRTQWDGERDVLEIGPFLGATTAALAAGMTRHASRSPTARLHVVDAFRWRPFMSGPGRPDLSPGESFRPYFEDGLRSHAALLEIHEAQLPDEPTLDLEHGELPSDEDSGVAAFDPGVLEAAVGIVFIDGAKSWRSLRWLLDALRPKGSGETLLVLQDMKAWGAWWVPMLIGSLDEMAPGAVAVRHVLPRNTVSLILGSAWDVVAELPGTSDEIDIDDGCVRVDRAAALLVRAGDHRGASVVALSAAAFLGSRHDWSAARRRFREVDAAWPSGERDEIERARRALRARTGTDPAAVGTRVRRRLRGWVSG